MPGLFNSGLVITADTVAGGGSSVSSEEIIAIQESITYLSGAVSGIPEIAIAVAAIPEISGAAFAPVDLTNVPVSGANFTGVTFNELGVGADPGTNVIKIQPSDWPYSPIDPSLFSPTLWLDPADLDLADGAAVTSWGYNSLTFTQGSAGAQPIYKTNIVNGYPVVRFEGDDYLYSDSIKESTLWGANSYCIFAVFKPHAISTNSSTIPNNDSIIGTKWNRAGFVVRNDGPSANWYYLTNWMDSNSWVVQSVTITIADFMVVAAWRTATHSNINLNGGVADSDARADTSGNDEIAIGVGNWGGNPKYYFHGDIAEIITIKSNLTDANRKGVIAYLANKYGIAAAEGAKSPFVVDPDGNVVAGDITGNEKITTDGRLSMKQAAAPTATADFGKVWVNTTGELKYMDDTGLTGIIPRMLPNAASAPTGTLFNGDMYYDTATSGVYIYVSSLNAWKAIT